MILSFHPCFEADKNIIVAGRDPSDEDIAAIKSADAVILPQGCFKVLYQAAIENCINVFPNFDVKFQYPNKIGQIHLFKEYKANHPKSEAYNNLDLFYKRNITCDFPFVFKFDWGGEGDNVYLIKSSSDFDKILQKATLFERTGQAGFLIQEYIPLQNRTLRVVVIGTKIISYWNVQKDASVFCSNVSKGGVIDADSDPELQKNAIKATKDFCAKTKINLAGFDFLFSPKEKKALFLEINYYFGRQGLGGSEKFYVLLETEIKKWIENLGLR